MGPLSELIIQNIVDALSNVSPLSGYSTSLIVERLQPDGNPPLRNGLCVVAGGNEKDLPNPPIGFQRKILPVGIMIYAIEPDGSDQTIDQVLRSFAADARKAVNIDIYRDGWAENSVCDEDDKVFLEGAPPSIIITCNVQYRHLYGDPYRLN